MPAQHPLPRSFISLYRLFLRTAGAAVLQHPGATSNIRRLWRPTFEGAAQVTRQLQCNSVTARERENLERWLADWENRMDNSLSLLCTSAQSSGVSHRLTRNLNRIIRSHRDWVRREYCNHRQTWRPQLDPSSPEYLPKPIPLEGSRPGKAQEKKRKIRQFDENGWKALGEVVRMAEGRHSITLGRIRLKRDAS
ncbi:hypothetical protein SERLA73DRAFT_178752 [Serpula lacrymans var. lacrymans S7.3]|uniref:Mitochondrial zinc maintenance protein 1, mitochondrial n=2 Tax=Serpula lacrymans var. lacrymans TaxID=341189 RepID=F8PSV3_SERL3|nr:uncharacterized protein SERLADRAFT_463363 [Serpula lacrymans var. lacrymans S7.9]EGO00811.1 hypothetical protein SERLA73DRAFT_178752 [Serpula lacrymans var. lacrymans S7.3]EGO26370.1 hypothetical protein SERLADRAFT_463363 [Serpula lacrymans var. lacrymans S7.9]